MKIDKDENDFLIGNEFFHVKKNGDVLIGHVEKIRGSDYISKEHTCPCGKDTYDTYEKAKKAINLRSGRNKTPYKCEICGHWHLTTKDGIGKKHKKYNKKERKYQPVVIDRDIKEHHKFKKMMKQKPSYNRIIKDKPDEKPSTTKVRLGDLWDFKGLIK